MMRAKFYCIDCGKEISSKRYKRCPRCSNKAKWRDPTFRKKVLSFLRSPHKKSVTGTTRRKMSDSQKRRFRKFGVTSKTREKIRNNAIRQHKNNPGPWKGTKPELKMKEILKSLDIPFIPQFYLKEAKHVFDFRIKGTNILIEVDGRYYHTLPGRRKKDYGINRLAKKLGYRVLRFWDKDIMKNENKVIKKLEDK